MAAALWMKVWQNGKCPIKAKGFIIGANWRYDNDMPKMTIGTSQTNRGTIQ
jgi:hypothetical protein